jgi:tRNA pseudouridine38-40 synthase
VAYAGEGYSGFAVQENARTVGGDLLAALRRLDPGVPKLRVASRTDAGVHARDQRVAFDAERELPTRGWVLGLLPHLPPAIAVLNAARVRDGFNPRFETVGKHYRYLLLCRPVPDPFLAARAWRVEALELAPLADELAALVGTHDFAGFASARDRREHTTRTIEATAATALEDGVVALDVHGSGFLHNMVRIIVGTAVDVARGRLRPGAIARALASHARTDLGVTAPPDGLYLERVRLREEGSDRWPPQNTPPTPPTAPPGTGTA